VKAKKHYLILTILIAVLCLPALANTKSPPPITQRVIGESPFERGLIGRPNPALANIWSLHVVVTEQPDSEPNKDGLVLKELQSKVEHKLEKAGVKLFQTLDYRYESRSFHIPELKVSIDMLKLQDSQQYVLLIQTSLSRVVFLALKREGDHPDFFASKFLLKADIWKVKSVIQAVPIKDMPAKVREVVLQQIETFIYAYLAANPKGFDRTNTNNVGTTIQNNLLKPLPQLPSAKFKYVASKNSKVFHRPDCIWAKRIKPKNLVGYKNRTEAIKSGKRPCKQCRP